MGTRAQTLGLPITSRGCRFTDITDILISLRAKMKCPVHLTLRAPLQRLAPSRPSRSTRLPRATAVRSGPAASRRAQVGTDWRTEGEPVVRASSAGLGPRGCSAHAVVAGPARASPAEAPAARPALTAPRPQARPRPPEVFAFAFLPAVVEENKETVSRARAVAVSGERLGVLRRRWLPAGKRGPGAVGRAG